MFIWKSVKDSIISVICQNNKQNCEKRKIIGGFLQKRKLSKKTVVFSRFCDMMNEKLSFEEQRRSHLFEDAFLLYRGTGTA